MRFPPRRAPDERFDRADWLHLARSTTTSARVPPSLRRSLLRRLAAPLSLLALMSGLMAYWLAWQYTQHVVDRSLADLATAISKQIQLAGVDAPLTVPPLARAMFSDPVEQLIYRISDGDSEIAGEPDLPLTGTNVRRIHYAYVFETYYQGTACARRRCASTSRTAIRSSWKSRSAWARGIG